MACEGLGSPAIPLLYTLFARAFLVVGGDRGCGRSFDWRSGVVEFF